MELARSLNGIVDEPFARRERRTLTPIVGPAPLERLILSGADRERLLHGLVTGEVRRLRAGELVHGFFTTGQGRILSDYRLWVEEASFWLLLPRGRSALIADHLEHFRLASRIDVVRDPDASIQELRGELPAERTGAAADLVTAPDPAGTGGSFLLIPRPEAPADAAAGWVARAAEAGEVRLATADELDLARIESGELRFGVDFGPDNFPQETGREGAVSYNKGCFLGQEIVARIHYRGGVQKGPCGFRFEGDSLPEPGAELCLEGRPAGRATSVARSPRFGAIGLGILHQRAAAPGTLLELEGGAARVVTLPFEPL